MAYSTVTIPGDGSTTLITASFALGDLSSTYVKVRVTGEEDSNGDPVYRTYTKLGSSQYQVDGDPAPVGQNYVVERRVPKEELLVDWEDNDAITEANLNTAQKQAIMIAHEALDRATVSVRTADNTEGPSITIGTSGQFVGFNADGNLVPVEDAVGIDPTAYATAAQGVKADNAVQFVAQTLTAPQQAQAIANIGAASAAQGVKADVLFATAQNFISYGPSLADGADIGPTLQTAINGAASVGRSLIIPPHPLGYTWTINTTVDLPSYTRLVVDAAAGIQTTANVDTFRCTGDSVYLISQGGRINHTGAGRILHTNQKIVVLLTGFILGLFGTNSVEGIYVNGSNVYIDDNYINNLRASAYVVKNSRDDGAITINNRISRNYFGGTGNMFFMTSAVSGARPEGMNIFGNKSILTGGNQIEIQAVLDLDISGNMLDQGSGSIIRINPANPGVSGVRIYGNYIACPQNGTGVSGGVGINCINNTQATYGLTISNNEFEYMAYGFAGADNVSNVKILNNTFLSIDQTAITGPADEWTLRDNTVKMTSAGSKLALALTEGAGGGFIAISGENYESTASISLPTTLTRSRWDFGRTFGKVFRKRSSVTVASPANASYVSIPHGLIRAPAEIAGLTAVVANGAVFADLRCFVVAVDATNVTVQVYHSGIVTAGNVTFTVDASI